MIEPAPEKAVIEQLIFEMNGDGIPLSATAILRAVQHPRWEAATTAHDWRAYVPPTVRRGWDSLPLAGRLCVFETAEMVALNEEVGAAMVTGPAGR
jgi:hypothetical protein